MVVDYSMPEVDGIQFLTSIRNANCMKILLTGIADEREAVAAFNAGLIDCYLKKTDVEMARKLASALDDAKRKCCAARGHISLHEAGATYRDPRIVKLIDEVAAREGIVEYYWRPNQDAVLMFDAVGAPSVFRLERRGLGVPLRYRVRRGRTGRIAPRHGSAPHHAAILAVSGLSAGPRGHSPCGPAARSGMARHVL